MTKLNLKTVNPESHYTVTEASKLLGVTYACVLQWVEKKKINATKIGSRYYILGEELSKMVIQTKPEGVI